jgi:hypothetical protein
VDASLVTLLESFLVLYDVSLSIDESHKTFAHISHSVVDLAEVRLGK